jgi:ParB-like chromosome segregation protein Spo0J
MKEIKFPVMSVRMIPVEKIIANDYNPNIVAPPEMKLLKISIEEDGYTQPVVVYHDKDNDCYILIDGFHRYRCAKEYWHLKEIPATILDKSLDNRMASTIRHNRARGTHQIKSMSDIVLSLIQQGWEDVKIAKHLGMDAEEVLRLKQITGLKEAFMNHEFSKSWVEFERKIKK